MDNIFKSYSKDNLKWYNSRLDLDYLQMYSRHIQKDLLHRCDYITAISYNKWLFQYFLPDLNFTNSNQKNIDISSVGLFQCGDIDSCSVSLSVAASGVKYYHFHIHLFNSNGLDISFSPLELIEYPNNNPNSKKAEIKIYGRSFRAEKICDFSILWFLFFLLVGAGLFVYPPCSDDFDYEINNHNNDFMEDMLKDYPQLLDFLKSSNGVFSIFKNNLSHNIMLFSYLSEFYITRFDYCYDFFLKSGSNSIDFHRLFRGRDLKFSPYLGGSYSIPPEYENFIKYDKKWHMDTGWLYTNENSKGVSIRCYDKQIKNILENDCDFYSEYMDSKYKVWRLEFEFHSDFCCPCDKTSGYDGRVSLFSELKDYTLSKRALSYLWLSQQDSIFYKKYPVVIGWENRSYLWKYQFIKKYFNLLEQIKRDKIPVSFYAQMLWFDSSIIEKAYDVDIKKSMEYSKYYLDSKKAIKPSEIDLNNLKNKVNDLIKNHWINSPYGMDDLENLKKLLS